TEPKTQGEMRHDRYGRKQSDDSGSAKVQDHDRFPKPPAWWLMSQFCGSNSLGHRSSIFRRHHCRFEASVRDPLDSSLPPGVREDAAEDTSSDSSEERSCAA